MELPVGTLRKDALDVLEKRLTDFSQGYRQNIAILGDELLGKTTLLKHFLNTINDEKLSPVYVDIAPFEFSLFLKRTINSLLYNYLRASQLLSTRESLELLVKRAKNNLPLTIMLIECFLPTLDKEKPEILFKELFAIIETFSHEAQKSCVIIFDEFHNLKNLGIKNVFHDLGKKLMFQKNMLFVFSSSLKNEAKKILTDDLSLLFGNFETIELQMLSPARSQELIKSSLKNISISKEFVDFLVNFTGGHPFYLRHICKCAVSLLAAEQKENIDKDALIATLERLLFEEWGTFNCKFSSSLTGLSSHRTKNDFLYLLVAIAIGTNKIKDLAASLRKQRVEITQKLNKLIELNLISRNGSFYAVNDRLMAFWLKFVHFEKLYSLSPDHNDQVAHFRNKIAAEIEEFITSSKKPVADRMLELFNQFEEDDIQFDRKKFRLSHFKELRIMTFDNSDLKIGLFGTTQDSLWLAAIKEEGINEQDITTFLSNTKKFKHKLINRIIVGLGDIDRNAKLLAKESNIFTWDIANINDLFDFYGKPRIIR